MAGVGLDLVDELKRQGYDTPTASQLAADGDARPRISSKVRTSGAGYKFKDSESLVRMRDHGVDPEFIASLESAGYKNLGAEGLVRVRDHGVRRYIRWSRATAATPGAGGGAATIGCISRRHRDLARARVFRSQVSCSLRSPATR